MLFAAASYVPEAGLDSTMSASIGTLAESLIAALFGATVFWVGARGIVAKLIGTH
ncbi:hypothetical protein [Gordonia metallireducens]|uniref:hypothetical protein n=1 Tax=Gordonia metallireducens TaxID=2897779 RepID=UPI001E63DEDC|nr:hypothetical protein [Gordonia metallireducens]